MESKNTLNLLWGQQNTLNLQWAPKNNLNFAMRTELSPRLAMG